MDMEPILACPIAFFKCLHHICEYLTRTWHSIWSLYFLFVELFCINLFTVIHLPPPFYIQNKANVGVRYTTAHCYQEQFKRTLYKVVWGHLLCFFTIAVKVQENLYCCCEAP